MTPSRSKMTAAGMGGEISGSGLSCGRDRTRCRPDPEAWGEDPKLVELLGVQGAAEFRALLDGFPEAVGVLWALRDDRGRIVDFTFGYGNPTMLRAFRIPAATRDRYTLLEALPRMRDSRAFDDYVQVCETGVPWVAEVTYDMPFGDGYMLGTSCTAPPSSATGSSTSSPTSPSTGAWRPSCATTPTSWHTT